MNLEDLRLGAAVVSGDGHKLGHLSRFVIDTESKRLTHIVIDTGIFRSGEALWKGGWGMSHDRIVPFGAVASVTSDEIRITMSAGDFKDLSADYQEEYFVRVSDDRPGVPDTSDLHRLVMSIPGEPGPYLMQQTVALRPDQAQISEDSPVWRLKPHQKIGEVERVIYDDATGKLDGLVIRRGFLFTKDVVLPMHAVVEVVGDIVRVDLDDDALDGLPEFRAAD
jgi:sporulation protein YlmC with PRC-barrel domain